MHLNIEQCSHSNIEDAAIQRLKDIAPILFLVDVALLFFGMFFANAAAWWIFLPFHFLASGYFAFVLILARRASRIIPPSFAFQRPLGVFLYSSAHVIQFGFPGQIPLLFAGYLLMAYPLAVVFLFEE